MESTGLRVHVLIDSLTWGGAETLLADFTVGARAAGIEVSVGHLHARMGAAERLREAGVEPVHVPIRSLLKQADRRAVRDHLASVDPDLLHTHLGYSDLLGGLAARNLGIPAVSTLHTMEWGHELRDRVKDVLMGLARRTCAARVIAVSDALRRKYLERRLDRPAHVVTVHNGIADAASPGSGPRIRRTLGLAADDLVVAMVSVLRAGKGHAVAATAVEALSARFPQLRLLVLGEGPDRPQIESELAPLAERAVLTGHRNDVLDVLDAVDILIHPSRVDAFPTALIEAMAASVPAIATNVGGIPEIVDDGTTGVLIPAPPTGEVLAAALGPLLADAGARTLIGTRARRSFERRFTAERWLQRLMVVYEAALRERPRRA
jgi:glycosyltransferase involved in cell wall biosynthesis